MAKLEDCLPKVREGAKLLWKNVYEANIGRDSFSNYDFMSDNWSVEEQPKKIEELVEPSYWDSTTEPLDNKMHREKINDIIRELNKVVTH